MHPTIFISIASYRDPDCQNTVRDLFEKAKHPERVFIGICWQSVPKDDDDCFVLETRPAQVRTIHVHASESKGACWARNKVQSLYQGEDYFMQVDSHMRFVQDWDTLLIGMLAQCDSTKPVLSTYPLTFTPPDTYGTEGVITIYPKAFDEYGVLFQRSELSYLKDAPERPRKNAYIGAGLIFASGSIVAEVPYDPYIYFDGEEITMAVRMWTCGWDIYVPNAVVAFHDYGKRPERRRHWRDQTDWTKLNQHARKRIRYLLGIEKTRDEDLVDIELYGLGSKRSLEEYEAFSGLNFANRTFRGALLMRPETAPDLPAQCTIRKDSFTRIWRDNVWKSAETRSGSGSTMSATVGLRQWLPDTLKFLGVDILADAGCGELNWIRELTGSLRLYLGYDIVPELIAEARERMKDKPNCIFSETDIVVTPVAPSDAILCRDVLTHLPLDAVMMALKRFRNSGARHLITTTHSTGLSSAIHTGGWQALDLTAAPFNLPQPRMTFHEGGTKHLAVWACSDLPE